MKVAKNTPARQTQIVINNESTKQFPAYHAGNIMVTFGLYG